VRGNKYLTNAIDEQWHMRTPKDNEKARAREMGEVPTSLRVIEVKKSRARRQGTVLRVYRDDGSHYTLEDATPLMRRKDNGQGDSELFSLVLQLVEDIYIEQDKGRRIKISEGEASAEEFWCEPT